MLNHSPALDLAFQALADSTRRAMVERLARGPGRSDVLPAPVVDPSLGEAEPVGIDAAGG
jgi:hypothetical protein